MRAGLAKQKNISMDCKRGISELDDDILDVAGNHRISWKTAESEEKAQHKGRRNS